MFATAGSPEPLYLCLGLSPLERTGVWTRSSKRQNSVERKGPVRDCLTSWVPRLFASVDDVDARTASQSFPGDI